MPESRQPNGRSGINIGKDKRYHTWVNIGIKPDGTPKQKHVSAKTATECGNRADEVLARLNGGADVTAKIDLVGDWLTYWLENIVRPNRAYKTYRAYESIINLHVNPIIGRYRLDGRRGRLEVEHVEAMYARLKLEKKLAPSYVLQVHRVLSRALTVARRRGRTSRNVCDLMDPPEGRALHIAALGLAEAQAVIGEAARDPLAARWMLGLVIGMRQGEVLGLRWHRVDLEANTVLIAKQIQRQTWRHGCDDPHACAAPHCAKKAKRKCPPTGCRRHTGKRGCPPPCPEDCTDHARLCPDKRDGGLVETDTKSETGKGIWTPIPPQVTDLLRVQRERQIRQFAEIGKTWDPKGLCFTGRTGQAIDPRRDHTRWEELLVAAGVEDARLHAARHTAATLMVATGADISSVQEVLRHANIQTTRVYVDVAADKKREAVERVAASLFDGALVDLLKGPTTPIQHR